nr:ribonucleoside-diphosphate reductase subunit alpha like [Tanacetum cinerariifolium]
MASSPVPLSSPIFKQKQEQGLRVHKLLKSGLTIRSKGSLRRVSTQERELNGDLIAKVSDRLWMRKSIKIDTAEADLRNDADQLDEPFDDEDPGGFLKLTATNEWLLGENTAPINKKMRAKQQRDDSERRTRLNLLQYEAQITLFFPMLSDIMDLT